MSEIKKKYEFRVKIDGDGIFLDTDEVNTIYFFRDPLVKTSSFSALTMPLSFETGNLINMSVKKNIFPRIKVEMHSVDSLTPTDGRHYKKLELVFIKRMKIIAFKFQTTPTMENEFPICTMFLANETLHFMGCSNAYNKILEDMTGHEAILDYEAFITDRYGEKTFTFEKVGDFFEYNDYKYEQILVFSENDTKVPMDIIKKQRCNHSFSYYFFDEFRYCDEPTQEVTGYYVNLGERFYFKKFDITEPNVADHFSTLKQYSNKAIVDFVRTFDKPDPTFIVNDFEYRSFEYKDPQSPPIENIVGDPREATIEKTSGSFSDLEETETETDNNETVNTTDEIKSDNKSKEDPRKTHTRQTNVTYKVKSETEHIKLYCPDTIQSSIKRYNLMKDFYLKKIEAIELFEAHDIFYDYIQFDRIYNLDPARPDEYMHVPISIVNIFRRDNHKAVRLEHSIKFVTLKYHIEQGLPTKKQAYTQSEIETPEEEIKKAKPS